ncbi:hypothetical protein [Acinetobacter sp. CWB-B33]|uniref:hypothetical protein n=1 Tax=Acinetobacter sp. CWB-B33 TaxID=2815724 RepID=UPI0031FEB947
MSTNLTQHPCTNKCSNFKEEQCNNCLIEQIEKREFDLGLAPDDAYEKGGKSILQGMEESFNEVFGVSTLP